MRRSVSIKALCSRAWLAVYCLAVRLSGLLLFKTVFHCLVRYKYLGVNNLIACSPQAEPENSVVLEILSPEEVYQDLTTPVEREHLWHIISVDKTPTLLSFWRVFFKVSPRTKVRNSRLLHF